MGYRYILRYYIDPGFNEDDRLQELLRFCADSKIAEVMFFYNPEELFMGYPPEEEVEKWFRLAKKVRQALSADGIDMSLNPWTTTVHLARGRRLTSKQETFQRMVGENGAVATMTACPLDKTWQHQLADLFCRMAVEIQPTTIWIEDDWRLHNHEPNMNYGGCFCLLHLRRFEQKTGIRTDRETLLHNITAPGTPHPWRKPWLQVCDESLREPAEYLQQRIHAVAPQVRLGLMTSCPDIHSIEGRDWQLFKAAFSPDAKLQLRPNLPPYTENHALENFPGRTMQTVAEFSPEELEIYPELENSPRSGAYSKSRAYSAWEIYPSIAYGSQGITINHYDMMGNGIALDSHFGEILAALRPQLDAVVHLGANVDNLTGVDVLFTPQAAAQVHSHKTDTNWGLYKNSIGWTDVLGNSGISQRLTKKFDSRRLTALNSDTLWTFSDAELHDLLRGKLLLDADSVQIFCRRGYAEYLGLTGCTPGGEDGHAFETIEDDDAAYYGVAYPRMCAQRDGHYLVMQPLPEAEILSTIRKYDRTVMYPGMVRCHNSLGGTILSCAHTLGQNQFFMAFFNIFRAKFMQKLVAETATPAVFGKNYPLHVFCNKLTGGYLLTVTNPTLDEIDSVKLSAIGLDFSNVEILDIHGKWHPATWDKLPGLTALSALYIRLK